MPRVFDEAELLDRIDNDSEFLAEMVQMLSTDGRGLMDEIRRAVDSNDAASLGRAGHTIKGMVSNFCAAEVQASAFEVEKIGKSGDLSAAAVAVKDLDARIETLITELTGFVAERSS